MTNKILVLGASGNVGIPLIQALVARGENVKAASRSGRSIEGAEGVVFDFTDPATFKPAFDGVDRVYLMVPTGYVQSRELLLPILEVASKQKVKVVFQSALGVDADDSIPYRQIEIALEKSGLPYVILRPNWFMDNFHTYWKAGVDSGQIAVPAGDGKSSFIDVRDIAECAAAVLTSDTFNNKAYDLCGPEALSYTEAANVLSEVFGKPISYRAIDDAAFIDMLQNAGVQEDYAHFLASIFYPVREGWTATVNKAVEELTGHVPRSLKTWAQDHAG